MKRKRAAARSGGGSPTLRDRASDLCLRAACSAPAIAAMSLLTCPEAAFADSSKSIAKSIFDLASNVVALFGGALVVWGGVRFGLALKDHQGGNAMSESIATLGGGVVIIAASAFFKSLDISWM